MLMPEISGVEINLRISQQQSCSLLFVAAENSKEQHFKII